jgi:thiosulfate dehydrogenase [quinone] large subunit
MISMNEKITEFLGDPTVMKEPGWLSWLTRSKTPAVLWNAARIWLGVMWIQAGVSKLWGAENPGFLHHNGAALIGFATHAYSVPGVSAYSWWASFLHSFVLPNASWIAVFVSVAELLIGIALAFGFLTPLAALGSLVLLFTYSMSGTASVTAFYTLFAVVILATWRTSGWIGVDGMIHGYLQRHKAGQHSSQTTTDSPSVPVAVG